MTLSRPLWFSVVAVTLLAAFGVVASLLPGLAIPQYLPGGLAIAAGLMLLLLARDAWRPSRLQAIRILGMALALAPALVVATWLGSRLNDWLFRRSLARYEVIAKAEPLVVDGHELVPLHEAPWDLRLCCTHAERERWGDERVLARFHLHGSHSYLYTVMDRGSGILPSRPGISTGDVAMTPPSDVVIGACQDEDLPPEGCYRLGPALV